MTERCPNCYVGTLSARTILENATYKGAMLAVPNVAISICDNCGEELVTPEQARANQAPFADAKRRVDGLLTSTEIRGIRKRLGLTQEAASAMFGGGANAFSKYERGEVTQSQAMDLLLRGAAAVPEMHAWLGRRSLRISGRGQWTDIEFADSGLMPDVYRPSRESSVSTGRWGDVVQAPMKAAAGATNVVSLDQRRKARTKSEASIVAAPAAWSDSCPTANHG